MSQVGKGEVVLEEGQARERTEVQGAVQSNDWASEFDQLHGRSSEDHEKWVNEFAASQVHKKKKKKKKC